MGVASTLQDDFRSTEAQEQKAEVDGKQRHEFRAAIRDAERSFEAAFLMWRRQRPEHAAFVAAVKADADRTALAVRAAAAGLGANDVGAMISTRQGALRMVAQAEKLPEIKRAFDEADKEWRELDEKLQKAKTRGEEEELEDALWRATPRHEQLKHELFAAQAADNIVSNARREGTI